MGPPSHDDIVLHRYLVVFIIFKPVEVEQERPEDGALRNSTSRFSLFPQDCGIQTSVQSFNRVVTDRFVNDRQLIGDNAPNVTAVLLIFV